MADKLGLGPELRELKIGQSFTNPKASAFHSIRYDFKPASVDVNKSAVVDVGNNNQVTVTVPHLDGAGVPQTVFKGSQRQIQKECVLVIDKLTGEITLERLSSNISVKKTRSESASKPMLHPERNSDKSSNSNSSKPHSPPPMVGQRNSSRTKVTSGARKAERHITHLVPKHSPQPASPNCRSSMGSSPKRSEYHSNSNDHNRSSLPSLPGLGGVDDFVAHTPPQAMSIQQRTMANPPSLHQNSLSTFEQSPTFHIPNNDDNGVEEMSDSSSSSSSSDSDSEHEMPPSNRAPVAPPPTHRAPSNGYSNSTNHNSRSLNATSNIYDDLQLSEDDSD